MKKVLIILAIFILGCLGLEALITPAGTPTETSKIPAKHKIRVITANGYLFYGNGSTSKIRLTAYTLNITAFEEGKFYIQRTVVGKLESVRKIYRIKPGEPVILLRGTIRNDYDHKLYVSLLACSYDSSGKIVSRSVGSGAPGTPEEKGAVVNLKSGEEKSFEFVLKYSGNISTIRIFAGVSKSPLP